MGTKQLDLAINRVKLQLPVPPFFVHSHVVKQQYYSCMKVSSGNFGLIRECFKKLLGPMFYSWCNGPLQAGILSFPQG